MTEKKSTADSDLDDYLARLKIENRVSVLPDRGTSNVAEKWKNQYCRDGRWSGLIRGDAEDIYKSLLELPPDASHSDAAAIIGTTGWTTYRCDGCQRDDAPTAIQIGDEPDYESSTVVLCADCARFVATKITEWLR